MASIEITGKTLDDARKQAADKLGVAEDRLTITILEETKGKGLFGSSKVRIKAETPIEPISSPDPVSAEVEDEPVAEEPTAAAPVAEKPARGRGRTKKTEEAPAAAEPAATEAVEESEPASAIVATQEDAERLNGIVVKLLESAELQATSEISGLNGRYVTLELNGKDVSYLVGKHGEVLNALQYLMNIVAGRTLDNGVRTVLDGGNYRRKREEALVKLAENIAREVKSRGEEAVLDALPAFERRIVHKALSEIKGVTTYSEGEEPNRRVVIAPAD
jgi:spoIIIJ-associated protein